MGRAGAPVRPADGRISAAGHRKILGIGISHYIGIARTIDGDAADVVAGVRLPAKVGGVGQRYSTGGSDGSELRNEAAPSLQKGLSGGQRSAAGLVGAGGGRGAGGRG